MKKLLFAALILCALTAVALNTNNPVFRSGNSTASTNAPGQHGAFITTTLYFAPSNSVYSNFQWTGTAYSNSTLHNYIATNPVAHRWEYLTNGVLVATNTTITNVWKGTNGVFRGTSYWAQVILSVTNVPGRRNSTVILSTNKPGRPFTVSTDTNTAVAQGFAPYLGVIIPTNSFWNSSLACYTNPANTSFYPSDEGGLLWYAISTSSISLIGGGAPASSFSAFRSTTSLITSSWVATQDDAGSAGTVRFTSTTNYNP